jgi:hypothetical protein
MLVTNLKNKDIIKFCKKHPNEIICYLNKDTLEEKEILNRYLELNVPFVVSKEYSTILEKYKKDKVRIYDPCYIGTSETIIDYHKGKLKNILYKNIFNQPTESSDVSFLPEIILFTFCSLLLKRSLVSIVFCLFIFLIFIEYELDIKHLDIPIFNKIMYLLIDGIHISIVFLFIYLLIHFQSKILLLNIVSFIFILLFCIYKQCLLTIINNSFTNRFTIWKGSYDRLYYFFDLNYPYINNIIYTKEKIKDIWLSDNKYFIGILIALNMYSFYKSKS